MNSSTLPNSTAASLRQRWLNEPEKFSGLRQIEIAHALGVSEGEWVDACCGHESRRLLDDPKAFIQGLPALGEVMVLTRNPSAVHEKVGTFDQIEFFDRMQMAQVANHEVDLRIFLSHWHRLYAVSIEKNGAMQNSLQVFDKTGTAVHKIFMKPATNEAAWESFVSSRLSEDRSAFETEEIPAKVFADPATINLEDFKCSWDTMKDTHEFYGLLKRFNLDRKEALKAAGSPRAVPIDPATIVSLLETASARQAPIMVFVGNRGCIQIHTGPVEKIVCFKQWINVLDERFNLHLRADHISEAWVVRKPTADGVVTSLELYDAEGREIAMLFGERKPGQKERQDWRELIETLKPLSL
ncbi:ChuX/HutX family heme-like substrate-binding protein [Kiritimatiellaeota bacterium B1221]|nr:ChuX/HutX family heme-like substrate-binding protein [Kiritimatiellaeota bacterium B1221]